MQIHHDLKTQHTEDMRRSDRELLQKIIQDADDEMMNSDSEDSSWGRLLVINRAAIIGKVKLEYSEYQVRYLNSRTDAHGRQ